MLDQTDDPIGPSLRVFDREIKAVEAEKVPQGFERRTLVTLLKRVSLRDAGHKPHGEHDNVFLAIRKRILRTGQRAFEKAKVPHEMVFSARLHLKLIIFDDSLYRQPKWLIWQGRPGSLGISR
jgi:hypothetical protein